MFIITRFNPIFSGPSGTFNTTFPNGRGKMVVRNHTPLTIIFSINNSPSRSSHIPPGGSHTFTEQDLGPYTLVYWSVITNEANNTVSLFRAGTSAQVVVEGYGVDEEIPDSSTFSPRSPQASFPLYAPNDIVTAFATLNSTTAQTTTIGPFAVSIGMWLCHIAVRFGIPAASVGFDATLTDIAGGNIEIYHINTGTSVAYIIDDWFNPPWPVHVSAAGQASITFSTPIVTSGPTYSVTMWGIIQ